MRSGRSSASRVRSATRAARFAERTEAKVAPARTSVPPAVASEEMVTQSAMARRSYEVEPLPIPATKHENRCGAPGERARDRGRGASVIAAETTGGLRFEPPGPGSWELDAVHFPRRVTRYWAEVHPEPFTRGSGEFCRYYGM